VVGSFSSGTSVRGAPANVALASAGFSSGVRTEAVVRIWPSGAPLRETVGAESRWPLRRVLCDSTVEDADSPTPHPLVHAIAVGLPGGDGSLPAGALDGGDDALAGAPEEARLGRNSYLQRGWLPPDPPPGHGPHRYAFQVFALGGDEPLPDSPGRDAVLDLLESRAIASGLLIGTYERHDTSVNASEPAGETLPPDAAPA